MTREISLAKRLSPIAAHVLDNICELYRRIDVVADGVGLEWERDPHGEVIGVRKKEEE